MLAAQLEWYSSSLAYPKIFDVDSNSDSNEVNTSSNSSEGGV